MSPLKKWVVVASFLGTFFLLSQGAWAATCTSVASNQTDWNKSSAWNSACGGQPQAGDTVVIANGTNILADSNTANVASITVQSGGVLAIQSGNTVSLSGNFTNNGTFTAPSGSTVSFTGTNQTVSGNVSFANVQLAGATVLTLASNITITGTLTGTLNLASTCPTNYTVSNSTGALIGQSCAGGGGGGTCIPTTTSAGPTPVMAGTGDLSFGNNTQINGGNGAVSVTGSKNGIPVSGATVNATPTLPALNPATFPGGGTGTLNTTGTVAAGSYGTINASGNPTIFSGGTYYITTLNASGPIRLAAGSYYIDSLNLSNDLTVTGAVKLYIGNQIKTKVNGISLNAGGNAGNLQVNLYSGAQFEAEANNVSFTGLIYSPLANTDVKFYSGATITGAIITAGQVQFGSNTTINYNATVQSQITALACPSASSVDHIQVEHSGSGLTCQSPSVTVKACADTACTSLYTGGVSVTLSPGGAVVNTGATGSVAGTVTQTTAGTVNLGATASPTASYATTCLNTTTNTTSCAMSFATAGFVVTAPNHVAGNTAAVTIAAMQANTANRCVPAFANVTRPVNLSIAYTNPVTGSQAATVATGSISTAATTHNLAFDATGTATLAMVYPDVGLVALNASGTAPNGAAMSGSGSFIAAPASFAFSAITPGLIKAGNHFSATITAVNSAGVATPNFAREIAPESVALSANLASPVGGNNPALGGTSMTFVNGVATLNTLTWGEVGNIKLNAVLSSGNYLFSGLTASALSGTVGRFIPDHFDTAVLAAAAAPMPCPTGLTCPVLYNGFVYSGQPFSVQLMARNLAGNTTVNYDATLGFSKAVNLSAWDALGSTATANPGSGALANSTIASTGFNAGVALTASPSYTFAAVATAPTDIYMRAVDSDNVTSLRATPAASVEGGVKVVSGRMNLSNAYGSELLPLTLTATVQYWNGSKWLASTTDSLTQFNTNLSSAGGNVVANILSGLAGGVSVTTPGVVTAAGGVQRFTLNKPGVVGHADISLNAPSYFFGASNGAGVNPSVPGRATFGVYKSKDEFIYLRENY